MEQLNIVEYPSNGLEPAFPTRQAPGVPPGRGRTAPLSTEEATPR